MNKCVGFTGTQGGMTSIQHQTFSLLLEGVKSTLFGDDECYFAHGDCIGADAEAHVVASDLDMMIVGYPPSNDSKRAFCTFDFIAEPEPYLDRNKKIVDASLVMFATPGESTEQIRSGTWSTVRYARKQGRMVWIVYPNGKFEVIGLQYGIDVV